MLQRAINNPFPSLAFFQRKNIRTRLCVRISLTHHPFIREIARTFAERWREYGAIMHDLISTQFFFSEYQIFLLEIRE